jgi:hypothetical protein
MGVDTGWSNRAYERNHHGVPVDVLQCDQRLASNVSRLESVENLWAIMQYRVPVMAPTPKERFRPWLDPWEID